jgi:hypothetical protein
MADLLRRFMLPGENLNNEEKEELKVYLLQDVQNQLNQLTQLRTIIPVNQVWEDSPALTVIRNRILELISLAQIEIRNTYNVLILLCEPINLGPALDYTEATGCQDQI